MGGGRQQSCARMRKQRRRRGEGREEAMGELGGMCLESWVIRGGEHVSEEGLRELTNEGEKG